MQRRGPDRVLEDAVLGEEGGEDVEVGLLEGRVKVTPHERANFCFGHEVDSLPEFPEPVCNHRTVGAPHTPSPISSEGASAPL